MCFSISSSLGSTFENKRICLSDVPQHGNTLQFLVFKILLNVLTMKYGLAVITWLLKGRVNIDLIC